MSKDDKNQAKQTVQVEVTEKIFKDFALFDVFTRLHRWKPLALFASILGVSAIICFAMQTAENSGVLLGVVLLLVGLGLPLVYIQQFFMSLKIQSNKMGLGKPQHVYTITVDPDSAMMTVQPRTGEAESYVLNELYGAWRLKDAIYLYVSGTKAYILPNACIPNGAEKLWMLLKEHMQAEKLHDKQGNKD